MTQDTRKDRRVKIVSLNVRYKSATIDEFIENHAHDVSRGGIFIKTANPFPPGTLLKFEIRLASDQAVIAGVGRVVWKRDAGSLGDHPSGMGVKFIKIDEPSKVVIDRLVNTREDAGKAYEASDEMSASGEGQVKPSAPPRPAPSSFPPRAVGSSSTSPPPTSAPGQARTAGSLSASTLPVAPIARKATMLGLGAASSTPPLPNSPSSPPRSPPPPRRTALGASPSAPPRPGAGTAMFPSLENEEDAAPKQEATVMKQAAELLEEALREAGGSMEEIGTNPLFAGSGEPTKSAAPALATPITPASEWTTADTPKALAASVAARRAGDAAALGQASQASKVRSDAPHSTPDTPTSIRPPRAARAQPAEKKKGSASGTLVALGIAAAAIVIAVLLHDQLFGGSAPPDPVAMPSSPPTKPPATTPSIATAPTVAITTATAVPPSSMRETPTATATAPAPLTASTAPTAGANNTVAAPPAAAPPMPRPAKPAPKPAPPAAASAGTADTAASPAPATTGAPAVTGAPPAAGESAAPSAAAAAPPPPPVKSAAAPPPKPKAGKPADDNPY
jgi:uncharacterized protein (TIGR02266 family)